MPQLLQLLQCLSCCSCLSCYRASAGCSALVRHSSGSALASYRQRHRAKARGILPHSAATSSRGGVLLSISLSSYYFSFKRKYFIRERERERKKVAQGRLKQRADPESLDAHLDPLESCTEWNPTLKVLTRHKNGANTPRHLIIKLFINLC